MTRDPLRPVHLRCGHRRDPLAVEPRRVRFSWRLQSAAPGRRQSAFQLVVERIGAPAAAWDSGRIAHAETTDVAYGGEPLLGATPYRWRVRVWDEQRHEGPWSEWATFETALAPDHWKAEWIGLGPDGAQFGVPAGEDLLDPVLLAMRPAPYLRRSFRLDKRVNRARLYATALGVYDITLNGQPVGDQVLAPGWTDYDKRIHYQAYDVTEILANGENVVAAIVADGWACGFFGFDGKRRGAHYGFVPFLLGQLVVDTDDGARLVIPTDDSWRTATGAIKHADLLMGERRDLLREPRGWREAGFDDSAWSHPRRRQLADERLVADPGPPVRVTESVPALQLNHRPDGKLIVDFGQNLSGWVEIAASGVPAGTVVEVRHGETLDREGNLYVANLRTALQRDGYVTAMPAEVLSPRFTFHGFRYAEITGLPSTAEVTGVSASAVHSDIERTGTFECSSPLVNRLFANIDWGQRSNFLSIPTDCPQRDERLGWLGDAQIFVRTACYNRDVAAFFSKWMDDVLDAQAPGGAFPDFAPDLNQHGSGAPAWADAGVIVPWTIHKMYGDREVLERCWDAMAAWMTWLSRNNPDGLWSRELGNNFGDWLAPTGDDTPRELLATAYFAYDAALMADMARTLGRRDDVERYRALFDSVADAFRRAYLDADGRVASQTQTAYTLALQVGLVPEPLRSATAGHLLRAIEVADWHLTTGFVGVGYILPVLSSNGHVDAAYRLLEQRSYPSWLYPLEHGATTIWERWDGWTDESGFQSPRMNSFNHYSLGSVGEWFYRFILGIDQAAESAGFGRLRLRPHPGGTLEFARGSYDSVRGAISAHWRLDGDDFHYEVVLPPNATASVHIPTSTPETAEDAHGRGPVAVEDYPGDIGVKEAVFEVESGRHSFHARR